jgi:hypothetical protein
MECDITIMLYNHSGAAIRAVGVCAVAALAGILLLPVPVQAGAVLLIGLPALAGLLGRRPALALAGSVAALLVFAAALLLVPVPPSANSLAAGFVLGAAMLALLQAGWFGARFAGGHDPAVGWALLAQLARTLAVAAALCVAVVAGATTLAVLPAMAGLFRPLLLAGVLIALAAVVLELTVPRRG